jgi:hypothetical protein
MWTWTGAVVFVVLAATAGARAADDKPEETPYYPLKVGNKWTYKSGEIKITVQVTKFEDVNKQNCAVLEMSGGNIKSPLVEKVAVTTNDGVYGVYRYVAAGQEVKPPVLVLKLPPKKDDTWKVNSMVGPEKLTGSFMTGEVAELKVLDKTYKNVVTVTGADFDANGQKLSLTYYFAKDVGMIKQTIKVGGGDVVLELDKFEPGK